MGSTAQHEDSPGEDQHLFIVGANGGVPRQLARSLDRRITETVWQPGGKYVYFSAADRREQSII